MQLQTLNFQRFNAKVSLLSDTTNLATKRQSLKTTPPSKKSHARPGRTIGPGPCFPFLHGGCGAQRSLALRFRTKEPGCPRVARASSQCERKTGGTPVLPVGSMRVELHACATLEGPLSHFRKCESESSQGKRIGMSLQPCMAGRLAERRRVKRGAISECAATTCRTQSNAPAKHGGRDLRARRVYLPNQVKCAREAW